jgi:hypothetical protein
MSPSTPHHRNIARYRRSQRGQTLVVALAVLFLLLFIGGLFVTTIGRNIVTAGRSRDTSDAQALAQAGLDYCNKQLNETPEGADWRPVPTPPTANNDPDFFYLERGFTRIPLVGGRTLVRVAYDPHPANPSSQALRIEAVGIPGELPVNGSDPTVFVTAATPGHLPRLRRELIAYKQIGLTDYARFITNKYRSNDPAFIGTPGIGNAVASVFGNPMLGYSQYQSGVSTVNGQNEVLYGYPMRVNGNLILGSDTYLYTSMRGNTDPALAPEKILASGDISLLASNRSLNPATAQPAYSSVNDLLYPAYLNQEIDQAPNPNNVIRGSNDANGFNSLGGLVRDGSASPDASGYTRSVPFITPPSLDTLDGNGVLRYLTSTRDSGYYFLDPVTGQTSNTGHYGFGAGIYINNTTDRQLETQTATVNGSYSLRADWVNPNAGFAQGFWNGPFYRPPGVLIELLGDAIRLTRTDDKSFLNPDGTVNAQGDNKTLIIPLSDVERNNITLNGIKIKAFPHDGDNGTDDPNNPNPNNPFGDKHSYGVSVVIYAEGNVRVKGVYGAITDPQYGYAQEGQNVNGITVHKLGRVHLTIVSGATAYIEGNLVRGDGYLNNGTAVMEHASTCAILAHDYVCLNTTMFMQPLTQTNVWNRLTRDLDAFGSELGQSQQKYDAGFSWGVDPSSYMVNGNPSTVWLFLRHGVLGAGNVAAINLLVNPGTADPNATFGQVGYYQNSLYLFNEYGFAQASYQGTSQYLSTPQTYLLGGKFLPGTGAIIQDSHGSSASFEEKAFPLNTSLHGRPIDQYTAGNANGTLPLTLTPGYTNTLRFQIDETAQALLGGGSDALLNGASISDYLLGALMVAPLDIRIEAMLYAQEKSFFVIPGYAQNPDASDTRQRYLATKVRVSFSGLQANGGVDTVEDQGLKAVYPFYNEPMDVRVTVFGSVAENYTAAQSDQQAWIARWGFIPVYFGSTDPALGGADTAQIVPDDHRMVHDPVNTTAGLPPNVNLVPGLDTTLDYRTPLESIPNPLPSGVNPITTSLSPFQITNGMRMMYDPALAMPYYHPTDNGLSPDSAAKTRRLRALRFIATTVNVPNGTAYHLVQVLPPIPRLPVCPDYTYAGDSEQLIGSDKLDTDNIDDLP